MGEGGGGRGSMHCAGVIGQGWLDAFLHIDLRLGLVKS